VGSLGLLLLITIKLVFSSTVFQRAAPLIFDLHGKRMAFSAFLAIFLIIVHLQLIVDLSSGTLLGILQALLNEMSRLADILSQESYVSELGYITAFQEYHTSQHGELENAFGIYLMGMRVQASS
jgi:hypothetical protein